ncbi:MAG: hypothetical protein IJ733_09810 [Lachnospiraceae bacterium]|nr:hypothetical protein [Lachnospiraceae bacterium]
MTLDGNTGMQEWIKFALHPSKEWTEISMNVVSAVQGEQEVIFTYEGSGKFDFLEFAFS